MINCFKIILNNIGNYTTGLFKQNLPAFYFFFRMNELGVNGAKAVAEEIAKLKQLLKQKQILKNHEEIDHNE